MGAATVARLHADPTFLADLEAAKGEFAELRAKGVPPTGDCQAEGSALALGYQASSVTAIDILLEPDATMLQRCKAVNARLLNVYPQGFALDALHTPHITMFQRFVRTADLDKVFAAEEKVLAAANVAAMNPGRLQSLLSPHRWRAGRRRHLREADPGNPQAASGHHCRREPV